MDTAKAIQELKIIYPLRKKISLIIPQLIVIATALFVVWVFLFSSPPIPGDNIPEPISGFGVLVSLVLLSMGVISLYKMKDYAKLTPIYSGADVDLKTKIIGSIGRQFEYSLIRTKEPFHFKFYSGGFLRLKLVIIILIDE